MQEHNFDEILDFLCSGIMSKKERQSVHDELYDHLMCKYEINLAVGMDDESAAADAVKELGDASTLRFKLSQVHYYAPKPILKKAMNLLITGYVLSTFHISFFPGMKEILTFIGSICMIVALFCLGKSNKNIKISFILKSISCVLGWLAYAIEPIYSVNFAVTAATGLINTALSAVYIIFLFLGLKKLVAPFIGEYAKKIPFDADIAANIFWGISNIIIYTLVIYSGETSANIQSILLLSFGLIIIILDLFVLVRSSKLLWGSDHEYKIEDSSAKKRIAVLVAVTVAVVPRVSIDIALANQKTETSEHTIEDYVMSDDEYDRICGNLLSYGIPENIVHSLPKSEIKNYSSSVNKNDLNDELKNSVYESVSTFSNAVCNDVEVGFSSCAVGLTDEAGYPEVRVLSWIDYNISSDYAYSDAVFWKYHEERMFPLNHAGRYNENFLLILSHEDDKIYRNEPLDIYSDKDALTDRMTGIRFEAKNDLIIIHAEGFSPSSSIETRGAANYTFDFLHRTMPFSFLYPSPLILYESADYHFDYFEYRRLHVTAYISWVIPGYDAITTNSVEEI